MKIINSFSGKYAFLSNFYPSSIPYENLEYPTVEHAYQAAKSLTPKVRELIRDQLTPGKAKKLGQSIIIDPNWELHKVSTMAHLVEMKFAIHRDLRAKLIETGDAELVEGNTWGDKFWGVCDGEGRNELGKILMKLRKFYTT